MSQKMMNRLKMYVLSGLLLFSVALHAQTQTTPVEIGQQIVIKSEVLNEERTLLIHLPARYDQSNQAYPVLYLLDGRGHFEHASATMDFLARNGRIPELIVVGIVNVDRNRDFTPTAMEGRPSSGKADSFIRYLKEEVFPFVENRYRTIDFRILEGHSLGGMFSVYTLFKHPGMFNAHLAMSPHLMYDENYVLRWMMDESFADQSFQNFLSLTLGNEPRYFEAMDTLTTFLETRDFPGLEWHYTFLENEDHGTVPLKSLYLGLEALFKGWSISLETAARGPQAIAAHYDEIGNRLGIKINPPEAALNIIGYQLMWQNRTGEALGVFEYNTELYPRSANVYDSYGEGLERAGQLRKAAENYQRAVDAGQKNADPNVQIYRDHLQNVKEKLNSQ